MSSKSDAGQNLLFHHKLYISNIILIIILFLSLSCNAQGDLFINPKRLIFEGQKRAQDVTLANIGKDTARYQVSWIQIRLLEDGRFEQIEQPDSGQYFADKFLRIFPRTVTLAPQETQVVKIQLYRKDKLLPGEYRSHLYFRAVPPENPKPLKQNESATKDVSIKLTPVFGISIPVIVRTGENTTKVAISGLTISKDRDSSPTLNLTLNRIGNMSVYGDITVTHISPSGKKTKVGIIKGLAVYTPNRLRNITVKLDPTLGLNYNSGRLQVIFTAASDGKQDQLAAADMPLK